MLACLLVSFRSLEKDKENRPGVDYKGKERNRPVRPCWLSCHLFVSPSLKGSLKKEKETNR
jgi:hypothetical protein